MAAGSMSRCCLSAARRRSTVLFVAALLARLAHTASAHVLMLGGLTYPLYLLHQNVGYIALDALSPSIGRWPALALTIGRRLRCRLARLALHRAGRTSSRLARAGLAGDPQPHHAGSTGKPSGGFGALTRSHPDCAHAASCAQVNSSMGAPDIGLIHSTRLPAARAAATTSAVPPRPCAPWPSHTVTSALQRCISSAPCSA